MKTTDDIIPSGIDYDDNWLLDDRVPVLNTSSRKSAHSKQIHLINEDEKFEFSSKMKSKKKPIVRKFDMQTDCIKNKRKTNIPPPEHSLSRQAPTASSGQGLLVRDFVLQASVMFAKMDGFGQDRLPVLKKLPSCDSLPSMIPPVPVALDSQQRQLPIVRPPQLIEVQMKPVDCHRLDKRRRLEDDVHSTSNPLWSPINVFNNEDGMQTPRKLTPSSSFNRMEEDTASTSLHDDTNTVSTDYHPSNEDEDESIEYLAQKIDEMDDYDDDDVCVWKAVGLDDSQCTNSAPPSPSQIGYCSRMNGPTATAACTFVRNTRTRLNASSLLALSSKSKSLPSPARIVSSNNKPPAVPKAPRVIRAKYEDGEYFVTKKMSMIEICDEN